MQVFLYSISWLVLLSPILTIMKLCNDTSATVKGFLEVSKDITMYLHAFINITIMFFARKQMKYLIEITHQFWIPENYDSIISKTRKERIIYTLLLGGFIQLVCIRSHLNVSQSNLYMPQGLPKHVWILINNIAAEWGAVGLITFDILVRTLLILMTVQLKMLNKRLPMIYDSNEDDEKIIDDKFRECVDHYNVLIRCADSVNQMYSKVFLITFVEVIFASTSSLYLIMSGANLKVIVEDALHIISILFEIGFCYCMPAQDMANEIADLPISTYLCNWQGYRKNTKNIVLLIMKSQKPFGIFAGGIIPINMQTFMAACKSMVSYCMFLRTMMDSSGN